MSRVNFLRASGWVSQDVLRDTLTIVGCGAIGSNVALQAAKMGWLHFQLWDADTVEDHNLPNQAYGLEHVGQPKVEALKKVLETFNPNCKVTTHNEFFTPEHKDSVKGVLVLATDTMKSRELATEVFAYNCEISRVYEARLGFEYAEIHCIDPMDPNDIDQWRKSIKPDDQVPEGPCNLRICPTLVGVVSSTLVHYMCVQYAERRNEKAVQEAFLTRIFLQDLILTRSYEKKKE